MSKLTPHTPFAKRFIGAIFEGEAPKGKGRATYLKVGPAHAIVVDLELWEFDPDDETSNVKDPRVAVLDVQRS